MSAPGTIASPYSYVSDVACFVDIYPVEGGKYPFSGGNILTLRTNVTLNPSRGGFSMTLAPDTLPPTNLSWEQIITPMSLVVIGMRRGSHANIVMIGVVQTASVREVWEPERPVVRAIQIAGMDLGYFFQMIDYYSLWYLSLVDKDPNIAGGILGSGLNNGDPGEIGQKWFEQVMRKVFAGTGVRYRSGAIGFQSLYNDLFEKYDVFVPYADYFLGGNGPWFTGFQKTFPFPFYEFFVTTDVEGVYGGSGGTDFTTDGLGAVSASAAVIARLNPVPQLKSSNKEGAPSFDSIDVSRWNALPTKSLDITDGYIASNVSFSESEAFNFFAINPSFANGTYGTDNSNINLFIYGYSVAFDQASINRYGYRPVMLETQWMADPSGANAVQAQANGTNDLPSLMATLYGRLAGYFEATVFMASGNMQTFLRPDIQIGTKFTYVPFKDDAPWLFYIEGVSHDYAFGGPSTTTLTLTRGLPSNVYADSGSGGLLYQIHIGNAQRINGEYQAGLPSGAAAPLKGFSPKQFADWITRLGQVYTTPQAVTTNPSG